MAKKNSTNWGLIIHAIIASVVVIFGTVLMAVGCHTPEVKEPDPIPAEEIKAEEPVAATEKSEETAEETAPEKSEAEESPVEVPEEPLQILFTCHACDKVKEARTHEVYIDGEYLCSLCDDCLYLLDKVVAHDSVL